MALGHKYSGFLRTKWETKTPSQKGKLLRKQYENFGLRVPNYLQGAVNNTQFAKAYSRIENTYTKELNKYEKEKQKKKPLNLDKQVQQAIIQHNKSTRAVIKGLETLGLSQQEIQYLSGKEITMKGRKKSFIASEINLREINPNRVKLKGTKAKKDYIKMLEQMNKEVNINNIKKVIDNTSKDSNKWFNDFLSEQYFNHLTDGQKLHILNQFNDLTFAQKEIIIKTELDYLREKYEGVNEEDITTDQVNNLADRINNAIFNIKAFGRE